MSKRMDLSMQLGDHVEELLDALDVPTEECQISSRDIRGCAPCHEGDNPTAWIYYFEKGKWFCWTEGCHKEYGTDLVGLIMAVRQVDCGKAIKWAYGFLKGFKKGSDQKLSHKKVARMVENDDYWEQHRSQRRFHDTVMRRLNPATSYASFRKLSYRVMRQIGVGYAPKGKLGGRVVLAVRNVDGHIVGFTGRKIYDNMDGPKWFHQFKKDINLFNLNRAVKAMQDMGTTTMFVVEGPWDMIKMEMAGFPNTVACFGVHLSQGQVDILNRVGVTRVVLGLDADEAGENGTEKDVALLEEQLFDVSVISADEGFDFGDKETTLKDIRGIVNGACPDMQPRRAGRNVESHDRRTAKHR